MGNSLEDRVRSRVLDRVGWFGIRADDVQGVWWDDADVLSFSFVGGKPDSMSIEGLTGARVNPDLYDIDLDASEAAERLVAAAVASGHARVLVLYRSSPRLATAAATAGVRVAAMDPTVQRRLEDKPWVETQMRQVGMPTLGWFDPHESPPQPKGQYVARGAGGGGGTGMDLVDALAGLPAGVSVSRYLEHGVGVNTAGCVFADGQISTHLATVQLLGVPGCTSLPFGYCGNDAAAVATLSPAGIRRVQTLTVEVGRWLWSRFDWRGAYGLDFVVDGNDAIFCELNPRFQGSSRLGALVARRAGLPGLYVEHLAAHLGIVPSEQDAIGTPATAVAAQVVLHNLTNAPVLRRRPIPPLDGYEIDLLPPDDVRIDPGAPLLRLSVEGPVTVDGRQLLPGHTAVVQSTLSAFGPEA